MGLRLLGVLGTRAYGTIWCLWLFVLWGSQIYLAIRYIGQLGIQVIRYIWLSGILAN